MAGSFPKALPFAEQKYRTRNYSFFKVHPLDVPIIPNENNHLV
jgi:hypothetical protein